MQKLPADVIQNCLANAVARYLKDGWEIIATGPTDVFMGKSKAKHNGFLGGGLLAPFSVPLAVAWTVARNLDRKMLAKQIHISEYTAELTETEVDYELLIAQLSLQQGEN